MWDGWDAREAEYAARAAEYAAREAAAGGDFFQRLRDRYGGGDSEP
jgi:hypothetical protein